MIVQVPPFLKSKRRFVLASDYSKGTFPEIARRNERFHPATLIDERFRSEAQHWSCIYDQHGLTADIYWLRRDRPERAVAPVSQRWPCDEKSQNK
jgi:hypothetical protein